MMKQRDVDTSAYLDRVKRALLEEWDPIGVRQFPGAADEYDSYAPPIVRMLMENRSVDEIFDFLWEIETKHMSLSGDFQATRLFASRLRQINSDINGGAGVRH